MGHPLSLLIKPASGLCNLRCTYCFYHDEQAQRELAERGMMSEETLDLILKKAFMEAEGSVSIAFQGGEPALAGISFFRHAFDAERRFNTRHLPVAWAFQTNGTLLDDEWCAFLAESPMLVGISVDGTAAIHNQWRHDSSGNNTYSKVVAATRRLSAHGVPFNILSVVTHQMAAHARDVYASYRKNGWRHQQFIPCLDSLGMPSGECSWLLSSEDYGSFLIELFGCWKKDFLRGDQPSIRQFDNWLGILLGQLPEACDMRGICSAQYAFEADGSCYPCDFYMLDSQLLGTIQDTGFADFDRRRHEIGFIEASVELPERCLSCPYVDLCRGGCRRLRSDGEAGGPALFRFCDAYRAFFDACLSDMKECAEHLRYPWGISRAKRWQPGSGGARSAFR